VHEFTFGLKQRDFSNSVSELVRIKIWKFATLFHWPNTTLILTIQQCCASYHPAMLCFLQNPSSIDWSTWGFSTSHCIKRNTNSLQGDWGILQLHAAWYAALPCMAHTHLVCCNVLVIQAWLTQILAIHGLSTIWG